MSTDFEIISHQSKRAAAHITKFNYHLAHTIPDLFPNQELQNNQNATSKIMTKKGLRGMTFHFVQHSSEGVSTLDAEAILHSARKIYIGTDCVKISENSYKRSKTVKTPYMPIYGQCQEIIEFYIVNKNLEQNSASSSRIVKSSIQTKTKEIDLQASTLKQTKKITSNNYELYVIHHCHFEKNGEETNLKWENFIQKYHFKEDMENNQLKPKIHYKLIFNYQQDKGFMSYFASRDKLYEQLIGQLLVEKQGEFQNVNLFQGYLLQSKDRVQKKLLKLNDPAFDQSNKKWLKLSPQYYKMFTQLRKYTLNQHQLLYGTEPHFSELAINSLAYRYMIAKEYNLKECQDLIINYLKWEKTLSESFNLVMFQKFHNLDFFTFLGNDFEGRAVVLNKSSHLLISKLDSVEDYCNYYSYFLEVYVPKKLRGYAEQYTILADLYQLNSDNFKLSLTKTNIHDGLTYCPQRQYKLIAFNVSPFATTLWRILKHLLPKHTLSKINIIGQDKQELLTALSNQMDPSVIPEYLGGKNKRTYKDDLVEEQKRIQQPL